MEQERLREVVRFCRFPPNLTKGNAIATTKSVNYLCVRNNPIRDASLLVKLIVNIPIN